VILLAAADDKMVVPENTLKAAQLLDLPKENVKIYPDGMHMIFGHDWDMSAFIYKFFRKCLDEK
jgi:alpha-beta hydrolase superfamily lysophospholipase